MKLKLQDLARHSRVRQFVKFCLVGGSGVVIDMTVLYFLADSKWCAWNVTLGKVCAAETALLNNFLWNELWTFRGSPGGPRLVPGTVRRLLRFHAICGVGIGLAVFFLHLFYRGLGFNLYVANFLAILLVTVWNFWLNAVYNWRTESKVSG
jgi:dolichol-phosphate mannosyltransferase